MKLTTKTLMKQLWHFWKFVSKNQNFTFITGSTLSDISLLENCLMFSWDENVTRRMIWPDKYKIGFSSQILNTRLFSGKDVMMLIISFINIIIIINYLFFVDITCIFTISSLKNKTLIKASGRILLKYSCSVNLVFIRYI